MAFKRKLALNCRFVASICHLSLACVGVFVVCIRRKRVLSRRFCCVVGIVVCVVVVIVSVLVVEARL